MQGCAATLRGVAGSINQEANTPPVFHSPPGVSDTVSYVGHFAPVAAITAITELVFPLTLWIYTFLTLHWAAHRISPAQPARQHPDDEAIQQLLASPHQRAVTAKRLNGKGDLNGHARPEA